MTSSNKFAMFQLISTFFVELSLGDNFKEKSDFWNYSEKPKYS